MGVGDTEGYCTVINKNKDVLDVIGLVTSNVFSGHLVAVETTLHTNTDTFSPLLAHNCYFSVWQKKKRRL